MVRLFALRKGMDYRLALFLHMQYGLSLTPDEVDDLAGDIGDFTDFENVVRRVANPNALQYLQAHANWPEISMRILEQSEKRGIRWCHLGEPTYPEMWRDLHLRPAIFSYQGEPCWLTTPAVAVVGSRTPSVETLRWMNRELSEFFRRRELCVVSGGARGVDQWAHQLAMDCGRPTICILPSGLLNPYPLGNEEMWEAIRSNGGCLLSTCAMKEPMRKSFFHIRNRWIAGLGRLCLITEANRRSGSILTANLAAEEGRAICTIPVSPAAEQGLGNLDLLADKGATLIRDHLDLAALWDQVHAGSGLSPTLLQDFQGEKKEDSIHQP